MIAPYFNEDELACMSDIAYNSIGKLLNDGELASLVHTAPDNIKEKGYKHGLCDTVFSDMMFV